MSRWKPRPGELGAIARFGLVGVAASLTYLGGSLALLTLGLTPYLANAAAFLASIAASYAGHYFFTYRSDDSHWRLGPRFLLVTAGLVGLSSALHAAVLALGASPRGAALVVTLVYPPLSFALNHFCAFARGAPRRG